MRGQLRSLASDAWKLFAQSRRHRWVVRRSIPILYFGKLAAYRRSKIRIITVGLNPSKAEFDSKDPYHRFPDARSVRRVTGKRQLEKYLSSLNQYYERDPYDDWFASFEPILNGLGASYYKGERNRALHTDLCSPIATSPTWSGLEDRQQEFMIRGGREIWVRLVDFLKPHLMLVSVANSHLRAILTKGVRLRTFSIIRRRNPYKFQSATIRMPSRWRTLLVFGSAAQKPFGKVSSARKQRLGRLLKRLV